MESAVSGNLIFLFLAGVAMAVVLLRITEPRIVKGMNAEYVRGLRRAAEIVTEEDTRRIRLADIGISAMPSEIKAAILKEADAVEKLDQ